MRSISDEAIVIGLMDFREADRIVSLFTKEHGRMSGLARGARRSVKRFGGSLELFARLSVNFAQGDSLVPIRDVDALTIYPGIRSSFEGIAHAGYACELVSLLAPERLANDRLFRLLTAYLDHLDNSPATASGRHFFEINLLNILGYRPPLDSCAGCGSDLVRGGGFWSGCHEDGIYCRSCSGRGRFLDGSTVSLLLESMKCGRFGQIAFDQDNVMEAESFLEAFIMSNISRPLKSLAFLRLST
ncbi:MAG TPA: DNA repair protein RecO [Geobacteraceae bacterium]|nr:DNA repair protein RecO [Geobacteraceae bacterium]